MAFCGEGFERLCREGLPLLYAKEGVGGHFEAGEYWDRAVQIEVVGLRADGWVDLGECRWQGRAGVAQAARELAIRATHFPAGGGRFSGGTAGLSIGHVSPEAAEGGNIGLIETGDTIVIDIPNRTVRFDVSDEEIVRRRAIQATTGRKPVLPRKRKVTAALKAYAKLVTSADKGAVRNLDLLSD